MFKNSQKMKTYQLICLLLAIAILCNPTLKAQTTKTVGSGGDYATLYAAFNAIQSGTLTGEIVLEITSDLTETEASFISASGTFGWDYSSITVRPSVGSRKVSANISGPIFIISGGHNLTLDGQVGGTGGLTQLTFENTEGTIVTCSNNATNNTIKYCNLKGSSTNANEGIITFVVALAYGSSNTLIDHCNIGDATLTSINGICSFWDTGYEWTGGVISGITISNCSIYNFWSPAQSSKGICLKDKCSAWTISNNSFYQTVARTSTAAATHYGIYIGEGDGHVVTGNYIGGSAPACGGAAWTLNGDYANYFVGIYLNVGTTTPASVQGNTIKNFAHTYHSIGNVASLPGIWSGIYLHAGNANIGTVTGNSIGENTGTGSITINSTNTANVISYGIGCNATGATVNINNNSIGSLTLNSTSTMHGHSFAGIQISAGADVTVDGNLVGSTTTANSIAAANPNTSTTNGQYLKGIVNSSSANATISNNIVSNLKNSSVGLGDIVGIDCSNGVNTISENTISHLSTASNHILAFGDWYFSFRGISSTSALAGQNISGNKVFNLSNTHSAGSNKLYGSGIYFSNNSAGSNSISRNLVYDLFFAKGDCYNFGIFLREVNDVVAMNNSIRLGSGYSQDNFIAGILSFGSNRVLGNSVYITGTAPENSFFETFGYCKKFAGTDVVKNNIFYNTRALTNETDGFHTAIGAAASSLESDFNNLYSANPSYVGIAGVSFEKFWAPGGCSFEQWKTTTGQDANSLNVNPLFVAAHAAIPDLHLTASSPMIDAGVTVEPLVSDYDGDLRSQQPDIGSDEQFGSSSFAGNGETYPTLKAAFDAINAGTLKGKISIVLTSGTTETATAVLYQSGYNGTSEYTSVSVGGENANITVSGNLANPVISLDGAHSVSIGNMIIENTNPSGYCLQFINSASENRIANCTLRSSVQAAGKGVITFGEAGSGTGNNNNIIDYCDIRDGASMPCTGIASLGTAGKMNTGNTITNSSIFNFWSDAGTSAGIYLDENNAGWEISGNQFFQTGAITATGGAAHYGIFAQSAGNHTISNNYIGGSTAECGGSAWTVTGPYPFTFTGISIDGENTDESSVLENTIKNFSWQPQLTANINTVPGVWCGIRFAEGKINISNNTIGSTTGTGSITVVSGSTYHATSYGIAGGSAGADITLSGNNIGSIDVSSGNADYSHSFVAIQNDGAPEIVISSNTIGSATTSQSIRTSTACTSVSVGQHLTGIVNNANTSVCQIEGNTIANLFNATVGMAASTQAHQVRGIVVTDGANSITGNTVRNLSTTSPSSDSEQDESVIGISLTSDKPNQAISQNSVYTLSNTNPTVGVKISGIYYNGPLTGTNIVSRNRIYGLTASSSGISDIKGITVMGGCTDFVNNMISLGDGVTKGHYFQGILKWTGTSDASNFFYNSVVISGTVSGSSDIQTYAFRQNWATPTDVVKNNIFINTRVTSSGTGKNYAFYKNNTDGITLDHNCYYVSGTGTVLGFDGSSDKTGLPLVSGQDEHSIVTAVTFTNTATADLHTTTPALNARATPAVSVIIDFDGQTRNPLFPDIGANEFTLGTIIVDPSSLANFGLVDVRSSSESKNYEVTGIDLIGNLTVTAPSNFEVSLASGSGFGNSVSFTPVNTNVAGTVYVRFSPQITGFHSSVIPNSSTGATSQVVNVSGTAAGVLPLVSSSAATSITTSSATGNGSITHTGGDNASSRGIIIWPYTGTDLEIGGTDVVSYDESGSFGTGAFTANLIDLSLNSRYNFRSYATNPKGTAYGATLDFWTLAKVPAAPTVDSVRASTVNISINANSNPAITGFAIHETSTNRFIQADGSMGTNAVWKTASEWGSVQVTLYEFQNRTGNRQYNFEVMARNGGNIQTAYSGTTSILTLANIPNVMWVSNPTPTTLSVAVYTYSMDYSNNSTGTLYAIQDTATGKFLQSNGALATDTVWNTRDGWDIKTVTGLDIATGYSFWSMAKNDAGIRTVPGTATNKFTLALVPNAPVLTNVTTSTADIELDPGDNPEYVEFAIYVNGSQCVQEDGTILASAVWQTKPAWDGTTITGLGPNATITFAAMAHNGDNIETVLGEATGITTFAMSPLPPDLYVYDYTDRLMFYVNLSGNPWVTEYAVQDSITGSYVQSDGYMGENPVWKTREGWTGATQYILGLTPATKYAIRAKARNSENIETAWGLSGKLSTGTITPGIPSVSNVTANTVDLKINPNGNPVHVTFAILEGNLSLYVQANGTLAASPAWQNAAGWDTITINVAPDQSLALQVKARNEDGVETGYSEPVGVRTLANIPSAPTLEATSSTAINIAINSNGNPASVIYAILETTSGQYVGFNGFMSSSPEWRPKEFGSKLEYLLPSTEYTFRVIARNSEGIETEYGPPASVSTMAGPPVAPTLIGPAHNSVDLPNSLVFSWNPVAHADSFTIEIAMDPWVVNGIVFSESGITATSIQVDNLYHGTVFYWRVNATNSIGTGSWSEIWSFTTVAGTGIAIPGAMDIGIYPNPVVSTLRFSGINVFPARISIINEKGVTVMNALLFDNVLNTQMLKPGVYLLKVETSRGGTRLSLIKM